ncbi:MAG: hypothetical protein IT348_10870, partial [Candidatus Eisenbacteria bacterium]|nr:hypothetical protein [Candidatus Eisenbacteria bacterium]
MPVATALALVTAVLNLTVATGHVAISRAPGWGVARLFAVIASTAALYSAGNVIFTLHDLPIGVYMVALRVQYVLASVHMLAWMPFAFGREDWNFRGLPPFVRVWCWLCVVATLFFAVTGWHVTGPLHHLRIEWADVTYHYLSATAWGHAYGALITVGMMFPIIQFARRAARGERGMGLILAGYSAFYVSVLIEALVASEVIDFFSPADIGFLCSVLPTSALLLRRFVDEAGQLRDLTGQLRGEVQDRTQERDRAQTALVESERHASLGRLAAGVGHEINNPLAYIRLALERMGTELSQSGAAAQVWESIGQAHDGINRIQKVVEGLRTYSRRADDKAPQDPREVVRAAMKVANPNLRHVAQLDTDLSPAPPVLGDEARLV